MSKNLLAIKDYKELNLEDYKSFFDETPVALIRTTLDTGHFIMANKYAAELFGYDNVEDLIENCCITDFYSIDVRKNLIQALRKKKILENYEIEFKLQDKTIWVSARLRISCNGSCIEGSLIDITEKVLLRDKQLGRLTEIGKKLDNKIESLAG